VKSSALSSATEFLWCSATGVTRELILTRRIVAENVEFQSASDDQ
jgi:hypothetical protein